MRLIALGLLLIAGALAYGLGEVAATLTASAQAERLAECIAVRNTGRYLANLGSFLFLIEYIVSVMRHYKASNSPPAHPLSPPSQGGAAGGRR